MVIYQLKTQTETDKEPLYILILKGGQNQDRIDDGTHYKLCQDSLLPPNHSALDQ